MTAGPGPDGGDALAQAFEAQRPRLVRVAYATVGSVAEAEDCVQEAWLRLRRVEDPAAIRDLGAWLTTTVSRLALDALGRAQPKVAASPSWPAGVDAPGPTPPAGASLLADQDRLKFWNARQSRLAMPAGPRLGRVRGRGSVGRASPCQGEGRGFESRRPLGGAGRRARGRRSTRLRGTVSLPARGRKRRSGRVA